MRWFILMLRRAGSSARAWALHGLTLCRHVEKSTYYYGMPATWTFFCIRAATICCLRRTNHLIPVFIFSFVGSCRYKFKLWPLWRLTSVKCAYNGTPRIWTIFHTRRFTVIKYYEGDQMKKHKLGRSELRNRVIFVKNLKGTNHMGNLDRDGRIVLQLILQEYDVSGLD